MTQRLKPWLLIALVFVAGVVAGVIGTRAVVRYYIARASANPGLAVERIEKDLGRTLELTPDQQAKVHKIMSDSHEEMRELRREFQPRFVEIFKQSETGIKEVLTPEQQERFKKYLQEKKGRLGFIRPPFGPPPTR